MFTSPCIKRVVPLTLLALSAAFAQATALYDNLNATTLSRDPLSSYGPLYDSFSTGNSAMILDSVAVNLANPTGSTGAWNLGVYADSSTTPGSEIGFANGNADSLIGPSSTIITFGGGGLFLAANTRYWVGITSEEANPSSIYWNFSNDLSGPEVGSEYFSYLGGVYSNAGFPYQMRVEATAVPEPASLACLGVGALALIRKQRRARSR